MNAEIRAAERAGDYLTAYDLAQRALERAPDDLWLRHRAVLNLARSGATDQAHALFELYGLADHPDEDVAALRARIEKDRGHLADAARRYGEIYARTGGYYSGINAATLALLSGDARHAAEIARSLKVEGDDYYAHATRAEAALILGDRDAARRHLEAASTSDDHAARATTRAQLARICDDPAVLAPLAPPDVIHYAGHRSPRVDDSYAARVASELDGVGFGFGSLACGADILFVEALLARGAEAHVVLPFNVDEFKEASVVPAWRGRFDACLARAASVTYATEDSYLGDDLLFAYAAQLAMGLARLRARFLGAAVRQVAVWDGRPAPGPAGTGADVAFWRERGGDTRVIACPPAAAGAVVRPVTKRTIRAMLFGDVRGYSKLREAETMKFIDTVLGGFGRALERHGGDVMYRNTWGDGLYIVCREAASAARVALDLQRAMGGMDLAAAGLPGHLALRVGAHVGPVFEAVDPVVGAPSFFGTHVTRTARVEPATPPGQVYATEPFAARLALEPGAGMTCAYVGQMPAAKGYGVMRMYVVKENR